MLLFLISFLAGVLTVLAPCILPLLPVIVGSSVSGADRGKPYRIAGALALSVVLFTLALKWSTAFISIPPEAWTAISGGIVAIFGFSLAFPSLWEKIPLLSKLSVSSNKILGAGYQKKSISGDFIIGAALGPVFSSCSPTYFLILATVLPRSIAAGLADLIAYAFGLALALLLISILGQKLVDKLGAAADPHGKFKRTLGVIVLLVGVLILFGIDKKIETRLLGAGWSFTSIEGRLLQSTQPAGSDAGMKNYGQYKEIADPAGFVFTDPFKLADLVGKKVILLDFLTYSCINCQRTFPYLTAWYDKYKDGGFVIVGIHTPEFDFEKKPENVARELAKFGITFPIVLDNDYGTWNAYDNVYWPAKYLIDIHGNIVYEHFGEGNYDETEKIIQSVLAERKAFLNATTTVPRTIANPAGAIDAGSLQIGSPETYFGSARNQYLANGPAGTPGTFDFSAPADPDANALYLSGKWTIAPDSASPANFSQSKIIYHYFARDVYFVASGAPGMTVELYQDGEKVSAEAGEDAKSGTAAINEERLYHLIHNDIAGEHILEIRISSPKLKAYTFTFG